MPRARTILIGGFLGAGKTTAILRLARHLVGGGLKVGLITNDQSSGLVDTTLLGSQGFAVEEVAGGCFCCRFDSLLDASRRLSCETRPDVFIAEPVGSCTDLLATVSYPLRRIYGEDFQVAPLSVLLDPLRALKVFRIESGSSFSKKVLYVYQKQLEEADIIAINKRDLLEPGRLQKLEEALRARFPRAEVFLVSAREGTGLEPWFQRLRSGEPGRAPPPELDYDLYAEGEALLGWLNCTLRLSAEAPFDGNRVLRDLASWIQRSLASRGLEIAHLKMTLAPDQEGGDLAVLNLVRTDGAPEMSHSLEEPLRGGQLILNLRAEGDPGVLRKAALEAVASLKDDRGLAAATEHLEHFRPARPSPVHRLTGI